MIDRKAYVDGKGLACPFCKAGSVQGGFIEVDAGKAFQEMGCTECEGAWQDVYALIDIIPYQRE